MDEARLRALIPSGAGVNVATGVAVGMDEARLRALIHTFVPSSTFESLVEMDEARLRALIHSKQIFCHPHQTSRNG